MNIADEINALQRRVSELSQQLAMELAPDELPDQNLDLVIGYLATERVALLLDNVDEVIPIARLTPLPESPDWVAGVLDLRGEMVTIIDVLARITADPRDPALSEFIVVCRVDNRRVGLIFQQVMNVQAIERVELLPAPQDVPFAPYVLGMIKRDSQPILLLSVSVLAAGCDTTVDTP